MKVRYFKSLHKGVLQAFAVGRLSQDVLWLQKSIMKFPATQNATQENGSKEETVVYYIFCKKTIY